MRYRLSRFKFFCVGAVMAVSCLVMVMASVWSYLLEVSADTVPNITAATEDADWIMSAVLNDLDMRGALTNYPGGEAIRPYQANIATFGLSRATQITGNTAYVNAVWNYLTWYANHLDGSGYMHDYDKINGVWTAAPNSVSTNPYDSTDAYAGTFLLAVRAAYIANPDVAKLAELHTAIEQAVDAIHSTQQADGLTWAVPDFYQVKLLEDNIESYQGLLAAQILADILDDNVLYDKAASYAVAMAAGLETLWSPVNNYYYWAKHNYGALQATDWTILSPDTMEQIWTISFNFSTGSRASSLLSSLETYQPNWDQPATTGNYDVTLMGWAYYLTGNTSRAQQAATSIRSAALATNRNWPFTPMAAGELIILETNGEALAVVLSPPPAFTLNSSPSPPPSSPAHSSQGTANSGGTNSTNSGGAVSPTNPTPSGTTSESSGTASSDTSTSPQNEQATTTEAALNQEATAARSDTIVASSRWAGWIRRARYISAGLLLIAALVMGILLRNHFHHRQQWV